MSPTEFHTAPQGAPLFEANGRVQYPTFAQWRRFHDKHRLPHWWLWGFLLYGAVNIALVGFNGYFYFDNNYYAGDVMLFPLLALFLIAVVAMAVCGRRRERALRDAYQAAYLLGKDGTAVRIYADRLECVCVDTVTVRLADAELWEWRDMLMVTDGRVSVDFCAADLTPEQGYALCCALYGKVKTHLGKEAFYGERMPQYIPQPDGSRMAVWPPLPKAPAAKEPLFVTRITATGKDARRKARRQVNETTGCWLPLMLMPIFTVAQMVGNLYNALYISFGILLGVVFLAVVWEIIVKIAARKPRPPFTLRFYSDRLVAENENERHVFPQALLRLQLMPDALVIRAPRTHYTLPFSHIEDAAGLQAFLRPAPVVNESVNLSATPDSVSKEQE